MAFKMAIPEDALSFRKFPVIDGCVIVLRVITVYLIRSCLLERASVEVKRLLTVKPISNCHA